MDLTLTRLRPFSFSRVDRWFVRRRGCATLVYISLGMLQMSLQTLVSGLRER